MAATAKRKMGRPPAGVSADGTPEMTSKYPKLTISIRPATKAMLDTLSLMARKPVWRIIDELVWSQVKSLPAEDRRALELVARRVEANQRT